MRKNYFIVITALLLYGKANAAQFTVSTVGFSYSPSLINAVVGDTINFPGSSTHPLVQVDQATWNANGSTPLAGGWGTKTSAYQHIIMNPGNIYYVCAVHHSTTGMKGQIVVTVSNVAEMIGQNNVKLLSNMINSKEVTVMNTTDRTGELQVYDLSGKLLQNSKLTKETRQQIVMDLPKGVYLYRFNMEGTWSKGEKLYITLD